MTQLENFLLGLPKEELIKLRVTNLVHIITNRFNYKGEIPTDVESLRKTLYKVLGEYVKVTSMLIVNLYDKSYYEGLDTDRWTKNKDEAKRYNLDSGFQTLDKFRYSEKLCVNLYLDCDGNIMDESLKSIGDKLICVSCEKEVDRETVLEELDWVFEQADSYGMSSLTETKQLVIEGKVCSPDCMETLEYS